MKFSKSAKQSGGTGFYFDEDTSAPADCIEVSSVDASAAINLSTGASFSFDSSGEMTVTAAPAPGADQLLAQAQQVQVALINSACAAAITAGFISSALGTPHTYPAKQTDQQNLSASVLASIYPNLPANWMTPFWCEDANGVWAWVSHTASQIQQAGSDAKMAILTNMSKNATLQAQIMTAVDVVSVQKINWG
ncbi:MAG: hypothetical protein ABI171_16180 [Collimonas sp.]|uniref:DUF4376 domain-containing protein n=1 Tax=Collimonas sp. TaxID=1963772 RepID=UPI003263B05D